MPRSRPMSFSDRQYFVDELATVRNLANACADGERNEGSALRTSCGELIAAVDLLMNELVGDNAFADLKKV